MAKMTIKFNWFDDCSERFCDRGFPGNQDVCWDLEAGDFAQLQGNKKNLQHSKKNNLIFFYVYFTTIKKRFVVLSITFSGSVLVKLLDREVVDP